MARNLWIIDTDAGVDDCQALVLAFSSPLIEVIAITTLAGNVDLPSVLKNTAETLKVCGQSHVPYHVGAERPLISTLVTAGNIHGGDGLNNYWNTHTAEAHPAPSSKNAVEAIIEYANMYRGQISIVTIGPLTNLALAVAIDPELPQKFNRVLVMGAAVHGKGNRTICSEFNVWCDPEASFIVFDRFPLLEIVPWETCIAPENQFSIDFLNEYTSGVTQQGEFIKSITKVQHNKSTVFFCDPITLAIAIDPSIVLKSTLTEGHIELSGKHTRGMSVINWKKSDEHEVNSGAKKPNLLIAELLDIEKIKQLFLASIRN